MAKKTVKRRPSPLRVAKRRKAASQEARQLALLQSNDAKAKKQLADLWHGVKAMVRLKRARQTK